MENTRREFLKKAALLSGGLGMMQALPASLARAMAINPAAGTTWLDAEHIVFLMQENRSFDHTYGTLQGVRGFNDPRAIDLPNGNPVWLQSTKAGDTYAPFRLNMLDTRATWMSSLPHSWANQTDARNNGLYDQWLPAKPSGNEEYERMPLTLGYYNREDIPFYYALADAFTVCDQHFCSSLTGTTPNRLFFWTGTIREKEDATAMARVWNEDADYDTMVTWKTFPERLEEWDVSWKIYQNEITADTGFEGEEESWLANFGDNPMEYFTQYQVKLSPGYIVNLPKAEQKLRVDISVNEQKLTLLAHGSGERADMEKTISGQQARLKTLVNEQAIYTKEKFEQLAPFQQSIHHKAFVTNAGDAGYRGLETLSFDKQGATGSMKIPKGDVLYQFRKDVDGGTLPTVSWLVAPENFSDHPSSAWYGAWYLSEVLDILTKDPEVWKKTIFILTYDENDGYFDHVPPFVAPQNMNFITGKTSPLMDTSIDYVTGKEQQSDPDHARNGPIGLGYRVPMVIASPWSRGGWVNSEVFDHTSSLRFLENFLSAKTGKDIREPNISQWRRTVCGDLTSAFRTYNGEKIDFPQPVEKKKFMEGILAASEKKLPSDYRKLTTAEISELKKGGDLDLLPKQEPGTRPSNALPCEFSADIRPQGDRVKLLMRAGREQFTQRSAGAAYVVYDMQPGSLPRNYAVMPGNEVSDEWMFNNDRYHLRLYGPNGFYREFMGSSKAPAMEVSCRKGEGSTRLLNITLNNHAASNLLVTVKDRSYKNNEQTLAVASGTNTIVPVDLAKTQGWYDVEVTIAGKTEMIFRYAGRVENGEPSISDPVMGKVIG